MAQLINITSEALQATVRRLLPSQQGFGEDLQATNVLTPIIDLTPTAEGSQLPSDLARAVSLGGATEFNVQSATTTIISTAGFYRLQGSAALQIDNVGGAAVRVEITDGISTKDVWALSASTGINNEIVATSFDFVVFLQSTHSLRINSGTACIARGSVWQVADVYGNVNNPAGFTFE